MLGKCVVYRISNSQFNLVAQKRDQLVATHSARLVASLMQPGLKIFAKAMNDTAHDFFLQVLRQGKCQS